MSYRKSLKDAQELAAARGGNCWEYRVGFILMMKR